MNTKSVKQCKHPKKMKSSKTSVKPEVFVLPPDILKQLGISIGLGNINVNQETVTAPPKIVPNADVSNYNNITNVTTSSSSRNSSESSILETANLMKKSVFLSPTFVPTVSNVIPGEIQLTCKNNTASSAVAETDLVNAQNSVLEPVDSIELQDLLPEVNNIETASYIKDQVKLSGDFTVNGVFTPLSNVEQDEDLYEDVGSFDDDEMQIENTISSQNVTGQESKFDNLYAENSNNNVIAAKNPIASVHILDKKDNSDVIHKNNTKINIISEETIPMSKLKELQLHSSKTLTPVPVNTIIATKKMNEIHKPVPVDTSEKNPVVIMNNTSLEYKEFFKIPSESNYSNNNLDMDKDPYLGPIETTSNLDLAINIIESNTLDNVDICMEPDQINVLEHSIRKVELPETCHSPNLIDENVDSVNILTINRGQIKTSRRIENESKSINMATNDSYHASDSNVYKSVNKTEITIYDQISDENQCSSKERTIENSDAKEKCNPASQNIMKENSENHQSKHIKYNFVKFKTPANDDQDINKHSVDEHNNLPIEDVKEKPLLNDELVKSFNVTDEDSCRITKSDKVKEIAAYLKKLSHIYTDKNKIKAQLANDRNKKDTVQSNTNMIKSKLCVQGVEKPGGKGVLSEPHGESKVIKTYARCNKQKASKKSINILNSNDTFVAVEASDHELNTVEISQPSITQEFCICNDFGRIAYYDYDDICQHIHFANNATNSELDLIFSIYSDEVLVNNNIEIEIVEEQKTEGIIETRNFCWNVFDSELLDPGQIQHKISVDREDSSCLDKFCGVSKYNDDSQDENNRIASETHDQGDAPTNVEETNDLSDIVDNTAETTNADSITIEKCFNANASFSAINRHDKEENKRKDDASKSKLIPTYASEIRPSEMGDVSEKVPEISKNDNDASNVRESENKSVITPKKKDHQVCQDSPKSKENKAKKRRLSDKSSSATPQKKVEPSSKKNIKCALCDILFSEEEWDHHVADIHQHIAWKAGQSIDLEEPELLAKLKRLLKKGGVLQCPFCAAEKKKLKKFIIHVRKCIEEKVATTNLRDKSSSRRYRKEVVEDITCGVCQQSVQESNWLEHIGKEHYYLSWKEGQEEAWNVEDKTLVAQHLLNIIRVNGSLVCYKCGLNRRRVKVYLAHIQTCDGSGVNMDKSSNVDANTSNLETELAETKTVTCGVCQEDMPTLKWMEHIAKEHNYLAWQEGEAAVDLEDQEAVWKHLLQIIRDYGCLICHKCGLNRKRVKLYLSHIETCDGTGVSLEDSTASDFNSSIVGALESNVDKDVECAVCNQTMPGMNWVDHICKTHNYLAWKVGEPPLDLDNEEAIWNHLQEYIRNSDGLICYKCGLQRKRVKLYLSHVRTCDGSLSQGDISVVSLDNTDTWFEVPIETEEKKFVECGVCSETVSIPQWMEHIGQKHNYLAWPTESPPLDLEDEAALRVHLLNISKQIGGLICNICGKNIKYSKTYLGHVKECNGGPVVPEDSSSNYTTGSINNIVNIKTIKSEPVVCGVCEANVEASDWLNHIHKAHQYIAWEEGQQPIDINDHAMVQRHLNDISKLMGGLKCLKCGVRRKYVKTYLQHVETCDGTICSTELSTAMMGKDELECALCSVKVVPKDWRDHAMKEHYNVAWVVGDLPIDLNSPYLVEGYIKEYLRRFHKLVCKVCGASRVSCVGFYAHVLTCGKSEEETEKYKDTCNICSNKYLRIYKSQHMTAHREAEYAAERKLLIAKEKELKKEEDDPFEVVSGRRKAAEKAKTVLEKYNDTLHEGGHHCPKCGFSSELEGELSKHVCVDDQWGEVNDSDESVKMEHSSDSDEESDDSDIDSNISEEEREACEQESRKKRYSDICSSKAVRMPYQVKNTNAYMKRSAEEFAQNYLTDEDLFPQWHSCEYEAVPDSELVKYMPPIEESCNLKISEAQGWKTFKRFASERDKDTLTMFVGASIQCVSWVGGPAGQPQYIALVSHRHDDVPRYAWDSSHSSPGLVQIWDCGDFVQYTPKFALGLAHDYGTFWAMDWCPSGARDLVDFVPRENQMHRLGLFAAACSNGSAYIFSVPYPSSITENEKLFYKIKPVAELRLTMSRDRKQYQASSIKWSAQKGHSLVVVGYSDGCTAFYDLNGDSPLLRSTENNITVFYPYHDERVQNSCIEDIDVYPTAGGGVVCAASAGGAGAGALQSHVACARVLFPPHWPAALLAGDDCLVNQSINELEWFGSGRRLGGVRNAAGCAWCGQVAAAALPLLRLLRLHPCYTEVHKQVIGTIQMVTLGSKRKRQNDELGMIVEPITYSDVVKKYGIEFKPIVARDRSTQQKLTAMPRDTYPERFPLSDVTSMKFCPSYQHHDRLAIALHAGFIFVTNVR